MMREPDHFSIFELRVGRRGKIWNWSVCTEEGAVVMNGVEDTRPAASYQANRALFLLLSSAPYRSVRGRGVPKPRHAGPI
jgi:hypothetical protein